MNILDIVLIIGILLYGLIGFRRGFTKQLVSFVGFILIVVLSFLLKNPLSNFFYDYLPFFEFGGVIKGVTVLNIIIYEVLAFIIIFAVLSIILKLLIKLTSVFEGILKATIILGIPSKILGFILGIIQGYIIAFFALFILNLPLFNQEKMVKDSMLGDKILNSSLILSNMTDGTLDMIEEFSKLKDKYEGSSATEFNQETFEIFLKYDILDEKTAYHLIESKKLKGLRIN